MKKLSPFTSIVLDLAATLFTHKTQKVFCGLKLFTHLVVSRWANFLFSANYPFNFIVADEVTPHLSMDININSAEF